MDTPDRISHLILLTELIRRLQDGWKPSDHDQFTELYFDLTDAHERALSSVRDRGVQWPFLER